MKLSSLEDGEGRALEVDEHAESCQGHAAREAAEEAARARQVALAEAATLRQKFIRSLVAGKGKAPAGTLRLAVELLVDDAIGLPSPDDLAFYLGYDNAEPGEAAAMAELVRKAPERRLPALALAGRGGPSRGQPRCWLQVLGLLPRPSPSLSGVSGRVGT